jgi:hypothetical protein
MNNEEKMRKCVEKLIVSGKIPSLAEVTSAILEARRKYALAIRRARREEKEARLVVPN